MTDREAIAEIIEILMALSAGQLLRNASRVQEVVEATAEKIDRLYIKFHADRDKGECGK